MKKQPYGVLILHGFASSLDSVNLLERPLKALGLPICMPVLRGHGGESPESLRGLTWREWMMDAESALGSLLAEAEKAILIGHSMGGLAALTLAGAHPQAVDSLVLAATAVRMPFPLTSFQPLCFLVRLFSPVVKRWNIPPSYTDPSLAKEDTNYHWAPVDAIASFLEFAEATRLRLAKVHTPALILHSRRDGIAAPVNAAAILNGISTPADQKRVQWFDLSGHEMFRDCEREAAIAAVAAYVQERAGLKK